MLSANLQLLTWKDVRTDTMRVNPALAEEIDKLSPDDSFKIVKARYRYGQEVLKNGVLCLPDQDGYSRERSADEIHPEIRAALFSNDPNFSMPMGLTLNNSMELFLSFNNRIIPFSIMYPGKIFALWGVLDLGHSYQAGQIWSINAGARSVFILPKISEITSFWRLKKEFGLKEEMPRALEEQWNIFAELAQRQTKDPWQLEVIYFSKKWLEQKSGSWELFRSFLMTTVWNSTGFVRNNIIFEFIFSSARQSKKLKLDPYLADTIKHLYGINSGFYPGFVFADDDMLAPINFLQKVFASIYELKYAPTFMHLDYLGRTNKDCYYSLQLPTLVEFAPKNRTETTNILGLHQINTTIQQFFSYIIKDRPDLHQGPIFDWVKNAHPIYFHYRPKKFTDTILSTHLLPKFDKTLKLSLQKYRKLPFCDASIFLRGCIQIKKNIIV